MDPNACPQCGARLCANRTCRCGWPKAKARKRRLRVLAAILEVGKTCPFQAAVGLSRPKASAGCTIGSCGSGFQRSAARSRTLPGNALETHVGTCEPKKNGETAQPATPA